MDEYREVVKEFYRVYRPLQKKHNLRMHSRFSIYDDGLIEIWEYPAGSRLLLYGKMQTLKDFSTGRQLVFALADFVALSPKAEQQNDIVLVGEIVYKPTYRETPRGKRISDIFVKVKNQLTKCSSLIPCICWNETADEVANWLPGDTVKLIGRLQSREYEKLIEELYADGVVAERVTETRTAYEVSVHTIKKEEVKNEC